MGEHKGEMITNDGSHQDVLPNPRGDLVRTVRETSINKFVAKNRIGQERKRWINSLLGGGLINASFMRIDNTQANLKTLLLGSIKEMVVKLWPTGGFEDASLLVLKRVFFFLQKTLYFQNELFKSYFFFNKYYKFPYFYGRFFFFLLSSKR